MPTVFAFVKVISKLPYLLLVVVVARVGLVVYSIWVVLLVVSVCLSVSMVSLATV